MSHIQEIPSRIKGCFIEKASGRRSYLTETWMKLGFLANIEIMYLSELRKKIVCYHHCVALCAFDTEFRKNTWIYNPVSAVFTWELSTLVPSKNRWEAECMSLFSMIEGWNLYAAILCLDLHCLQWTQFTTSVRDRKAKPIISFSCSLKSRWLPWYNPLTNTKLKRVSGLTNGKQIELGIVRLILLPCCLWVCHLMSAAALFSLKSEFKGLCLWEKQLGCRTLDFINVSKCYTFRPRMEEGTLYSFKFFLP